MWFLILKQLRHNLTRSISLAFIFALLTACSLAPKYQRPFMPLPQKYSTTVPKTKNALAQAQLDPTWWRVYSDSVLNSLEEKINLSNQDLKIAIARFDQARADVSIAKAAYYPTIIGIENSNRQKTSANIANKSTVPLYSDNLLAVNFQYEIDAWGRIRNAVAAANHVAQSNAEDVLAIQLSLQAELARDYFMLRGDDISQHILNKTVHDYQQQLFLIKQRYQIGTASSIDVDQAQSQLDSAKTAAEDIKLQRDQLEHAIAVLIGLTPETFTIKPSLKQMKWVAVRPDFPCRLLLRRPDIKEAEYLVQAANANIGVARAAFFPSLNFSLAGGIESAAIGKLFSAPSTVWAIGPTTASALLNDGSMPILTQTLFDGGKIAALSYQAHAKYFETVANYRQTVLHAFQEVEDQLTAMRQLNLEKQTETAAAAAANRALQQAIYRYQGGIINYLDVIVIDNIALQTQLSSANIYTQRQIASVNLIKALGGSWLP